MVLRGTVPPATVILRREIFIVVTLSICQPINVTFRSVVDVGIPNMGPGIFHISVQLNFFFMVSQNIRNYVSMKGSILQYINAFCEQ